MTTSDGITDSDWESIIISAEEIAELTGREIDARFAQKKILSQLDRLEKKYGRLPTILSTKADYIDSTDERLSLLKEAYITADEIQDKKKQGIYQQFHHRSLSRIARKKILCPVLVREIRERPERLSQGRISSRSTRAVQ